MSFGAPPPGMDEYQRLMAERADDWRLALFCDNLLDTHPPLERRIQRLERLERALHGS